MMMTMMMTMMMMRKATTSTTYAREWAMPQVPTSLLRAVGLVVALRIITMTSFDTFYGSSVKTMARTEDEAPCAQASRPHVKSGRKILMFYISSFLPFKEHADPSHIRRGCHHNSVSADYADIKIRNETTQQNRSFNDRIYSGAGQTKENTTENANRTSNRIDQENISHAKLNVTMTANMSDVVWKYFFPGNVFELKEIPMSDIVARGKEYTAMQSFRTESFAAPALQRASTASESWTIKQIWIWGERCSCTTAITDIIARNFDVQCSTNPTRRRTKCVIGGLPWKHDFMRRANLAKAGVTLHILATRHPYEWLESMQRNGFYAPFHKGLRMDKFLALEWISLEMNPNSLPMVENFLRANPPHVTSSTGGKRRLFGMDSASNSLLASKNQLISSNSSEAKTWDRNESWVFLGHGRHSKNHTILSSWKQKLACSARTHGEGPSTHRASTESSCWLADIEYTCVPSPYPSAAGTEELTSPMKGCLSGAFSRHFCHPRAILCERHHPFFNSLQAKAWEQASNYVAHVNDLQDDKFQDTLSLSNIGHDGEASKREDLRSDASCTGLRGCFDPPSSIAPRPGKHAEHSFRHSTFRSGTAQRCCVQNNAYECVVTPGNFHFQTRPDISPSRFCLEAGTSFVICSDGVFLCRSDKRRLYPWDIDPLAWHFFSESVQRSFQLTKRMMQALHPRTSSELEVKVAEGLQKESFFHTGTPFLPAQATQSAVIFGSGQVVRSFQANINSSLSLGDVKFKELLKDRDPDTGQRFPNVIALREAKLRDWLRVSQTLRYSHHVTCRDFMLDPRELLETLENKFMLIRKSHLGWETDLCVWRFKQNAFLPLPLRFAARGGVRVPPL
mmetsp:Transcript_58943/g.156120  ORF Transcript_58943/g.156120 Transcript_58943/m.156120 type:complete len:850 (-) Transcript_58943:192-2741(-)